MARQLSRALEMDERAFNILYNSIRDGRNYAPTTQPELYLFVESFLEGLGEEVETFKGKVSRESYAELLKDARKNLKEVIAKLSSSPYAFFLNLLPKDLVAFQFFLSHIYPLLIASGSSPKDMERLVSFLSSLPKERYFKALRFLARYLKRYGSPSLALILALLKALDWDRWKDD